MILARALKSCCCAALLLSIVACSSAPTQGGSTSVVVVTVSTSPPVTPTVSVSSRGPSSGSETNSSTSLSWTALDPAAQEAADRAAIESQWTAFWRAWGDILRTPVDQREAVLAALATPGMNERMRNAVADNNGSGIDNYGYVVHEIMFPLSIDGAPIVSIVDCQDQTQAGTVETATGKILTAGKARIHIRGEMQKGDDGIWRVNSITEMGGDC